MLCLCGSHIQRSYQRSWFSTDERFSILFSFVHREEKIHEKPPTKKSSRFVVNAFSFKRYKHLTCLSSYCFSLLIRIRAVWCACVYRKALCSCNVNFNRHQSSDMNGIVSVFVFVWVAALKGEHFCLPNWIRQFETASSKAYVFTLSTFFSALLLWISSK